MKLKFIFLFFSILFIIYLIFNSNVKLLSGIKLSPQRMSNWCWAASTEMVINYSKGYVDTIRQCSLVESSSCDCCNLECKDDTCGDCNNTLEIDQFPEIFAKLSFKSDTIPNIIDSSEITAQINLNKPFIISNVVQDNGNNGYLWSNHTFVGYGYLNTFDKQWVFIKDPWNTCVGCTYAISYSSLKNGGENLSREYADYQTPFTFYNFTPIEPENSNLELIQKYYYLALNYLHSTFTIEKLSKKHIPFKKIDSKNIITYLNPLLNNASSDMLKEVGLSDNSIKNFQISETFLGKNLLLNPKESKIELAKRIIMPDETIVIVNVLDERGNPISEITLVKNGDYWEVSKFASCTWLPFAKAVAKSKTETNLPKIDLSKIIEKEHITLLPTQYQFYKVESEGIIYYYPRNNYPDIPNTFYTQATFAYEIAPKIAKDYYEDLFSSKLPGVVPSKYSLKPTSSPKPSQPLPKLN